MKRLRPPFKDEVNCEGQEMTINLRKQKFPWLFCGQAPGFRKPTILKEQPDPTRTHDPSMFSKIPFDVINKVLHYLSDDELFDSRMVNSIFYKCYFDQSPGDVPICDGCGRDKPGMIPTSLTDWMEKQFSFNYTRALTLAEKGRKFPQARLIVAIFAHRVNRISQMEYLDEIHFPQLTRLILYPPLSFRKFYPPVHPHVMYVELREAYAEYIAHSLQVYPNLKILKARLQMYVSAVDWEIINETADAVFPALTEIVIEIRGWRKYTNWGVFNSVTFPNLEKCTIREIDFCTMRESRPAAVESYERTLRQGMNVLGKQQFKLDVEVLKDYNRSKFF